MKSLIVVLLCAWVAQVSAAPPPVAEDSLLLRLLELTETQHPELRSMDEMAKAEQFRTRMKSGWMNPMLRAGVMNAPLPSLAIDEEPMTMLQVGIMQRIPNFQRIRAERLAGNARYTAAVDQVEYERSNMRQMTRMAWYERLAAVATKAVYSEGDSLINLMNAAARAMVANGMATSSEMILITAEQANWNAQTQVNEAKIERLTADLLYYSAIDRNEFVLDDKLPATLPPHIDISDSALKKKIEQSPRVRAAIARQTAAQLSWDVSKHQWLPDIEAMFAYAYRAPLKMTSSSVSHTGEPVTEATTVNQDPLVSLEFTIPIPLFAASNQRAMIAEEKSMYESAKLSVANEYAKLYSEVVGKRAELYATDAQAKLLLYNSIPALQAAFKTELANYRNGTGTLMRVNELRMKYLMAKMDEIMLRADTWARYGNWWELI